MGVSDATPEGTACVVTHAAPPPGLAGVVAGLGPRVRTLAAHEVKGLEFDLVVLVEGGPADDAAHPDTGAGPAVTAAVDRYVVMTRATQRLVVLETR